MNNFDRILDIKLPRKQSAFLWGARKTGKSTFLKERFPDSVRIDFLDTREFLEFSKRPYLLRERLLALPKTDLVRPIILDEVQKVPQILDEVHGLIENQALSFVLCGSSARKLKANHANLLGGRAWRYEMFPLVSKEIGNIDLSKALNRGTIPAHYLQDEYQKSLSAYVNDYLKEEVFAEGLVRNIPAFSRFFEAAGYSHGELLNYANIARDCGVDAKTVKQYYEILADTLLGTFVPPFHKRQSRRVLTQTSKFYLFDVGIAGAVIKRTIPDLKGEMFGKAFEHFIFTELNAQRSYSGSNHDICYWRTKTGLEVDFILGGKVAVEVKGSDRVDSSDLKPMKAFMEEYRPARAIIVCQETARRVSAGISIIPWRDFLKDLWAGKIIG